MEEALQNPSPHTHSQRPRHNAKPPLSHPPPPIPLAQEQKPTGIITERDATSPLYRPLVLYHTNMKRGNADNGSSRGSKLRRLMGGPLRVLCRARDMYVSSMMGLADRASYHGVVGYPGTAVPATHHFHLRRGGNSGEDDLRELVRAASKGAVGGARTPDSHAMGGSAVVPRSQSVGMARIDEDSPCDFGGDAMVVGSLCPRSKSCPVAN